MEDITKPPMLLCEPKGRPPRLEIDPPTLQSVRDKDTLLLPRGSARCWTPMTSICGSARPQDTEQESLALLNQLAGMLPQMTEKLTTNILNSQREMDLHLQAMLDAMDIRLREFQKLHTNLFGPGAELLSLAGDEKSVTLAEDRISFGILLQQQQEQRLQHDALIQKLDVLLPAVEQIHMHHTNMANALDGYKAEDKLNVVSADEETALPDQISPANHSGVDSDNLHSSFEEIMEEIQEKEYAEKKLRDVSPANRIRHFVRSGHFELVMGLVIIVNTLVTLIALQWKGVHAKHMVALRADDGGWPSAEKVFEKVDIFFTLLYVLELCLRIWADGLKFFRASMLNFVDAVIVLVCIIERFISGANNFAVLRMMRVFRILRFVKLLRFADQVADLHILVHTLKISLRGIVWSILLIFSVVIMGAVLLVQLSNRFLLDDSYALDKRQWLYRHFGTTARSTFTMFECTFTGGWRFYARDMIEHFSTMFAPFWVLYIVLVNFMTMRVVGALFLKQTLSVAAHDDEKRAMGNLKEKQFFSEQIRKVFEEADTSGDGAISKEEFDEMMADEVVVMCFQKLDLEVDEVQALFNVLSSDDGLVDYEEFLRGALKMKTSSHTLDTIQMMHSQLTISRNIQELHEQLTVVAGKRMKPEAK